MLSIILLSIFFYVNITPAKVTRVTIDSGIKQVAVVGNGPLTEQNIVDINNCDIVYRFNHAPRFKKRKR
jgi:hypothetical protein